MTRKTCHILSASEVGQDSEFMLSAIVGHSPSVLSLKTIDGCYVLANPNLQSILQLPEEMIVGRTDFDLYPFEAAREFRINDEKTLRCGARLSLEERVPVRGQLRIYMSHMFPVLSTEGHPKYICRISLDITDRKQAELDLRASERRFRATFDQAAVGLAHVDIQGQWMRVNQKLCDIVGYPHDELMRLRFQDITHPDDLQIDLDCMQQLLAGLIPSYQIEKRYRHKRGDYVWITLTVALVRKPDYTPDYFISVIEDITQRKLAEQRAREAALHDPLTGLPNRALAFEYGQHLIASSQRTHSGMSLLFIDLDRFKPINDVHGHETGDRVLQEIARRLLACTRQEDMVARIGGDEFLVFLPHLPSRPQRAMVVARHLMNAISQPIALGSLELHVTPSIGISCHPEDALDLDQLIHAADLAMYQAKQAGRANFHLYSRELEREAETALAIEMKLKRALNDGGLMLHYQPMIDIQSRQLAAAEALVRLQDSDGELIGPNYLIPVAEATGLISALGNWVAREACRQIGQWRSEGLPPVPVAINVSPLQFRQPDFVPQLIRTIDSARIDPSWLQLEVTESTVMDNVESVIHALQTIKALGVSISLDDFGTGYSSLSMLTSLPLDKLKIDQSFVRKMIHDETSHAVTRAIIALGETLKLTLVAEGIETEDALQYLHDTGCHQAQGYLISRPLSAEAFARWWKQGLQ